MDARMEKESALGSLTTKSVLIQSEIEELYLLNAFQGDEKMTMFAPRLHEMTVLRRVEIFLENKIGAGGRQTILNGLERSKHLEKFAIADMTGKVYFQGHIDFLLRLNKKGARAVLGSFKPNQLIELVDEFRDDRNATLYALGEESLNFQYLVGYRLVPNGCGQRNLCIECDRSI
jgi:hypothetical protein